MRIREVKIAGFRSVKSDAIDLGRLATFIGRNGAGKSAILQAVRAFIEPDRTIEASDFFNGYADGKVAEIRITFTDLSPEEQSAFLKYTRTGELTVGKRFNSPGKGIYYGYSQRVPQLAAILQSGSKPDQRRAFNEIVDSGQFEGLSRAANHDQMLANIEDWQRTHPDKCEWIEEGTQFYGFAGKYALNEYTKFVFVPAVRDAADEISGGSLKELMNTVVLRRINENPKIADFTERLQKEAEGIFNLENFPELANLAIELNKTLRELSPGASIGIDWGRFVPPALRPPQYETVLTEDGYTGDPSKKGHGLQRALIITLLQHLQTAIKAEPGTDQNEKTITEPQPPTRTDLVLIVEEPELYLHPHRARYLANLLASLSDSTVRSSRNQILCSTHSPYFVQIERFQQVHLVSKMPSDEPGEPKVSRCKFLSIESAGRRLQNTCEIPAGTDPSITFISRCRSVLNSIINEGFFGNAVLVVEGQTELGVFAALASLMSAEWDEKGIVVVAANGKNNLDRPIIVFEGFGIPVYWVFDTDENSRGSEKEKVAAKNLNLQKELGAILSPEAFPRTYVGEKCAAFSNNIETYLRETLGADNFDSIRQEIAEEQGYSSEEKVGSILRNAAGASLFVIKAYERGLCLPKLEEIINKVTALSQ